MSRPKWTSCAELVLSNLNEDDPIGARSLREGLIASEDFILLRRSYFYISCVSALSWSVHYRSEG